VLKILKFNVDNGEGEKNFCTIYAILVVFQPSFQVYILLSFYQCCRNCWSAWEYLCYCYI